MRAFTKIHNGMNILLGFTDPATYAHVFEAPKTVKVGALLRKGEDEQCVEFELPTGSFTELQNMIRIHFSGWRFVESWPIQDAAKLA